MEIQQLLVDETLGFINNFIRKSRITIGGVEKEFDIHKTRIEGNRIKKYVYITSERGVISEAKLIDSKGRDVQVKKMSIKKGTSGFMVVFQIDIKIEGVTK